MPIVPSVDPIPLPATAGGRQSAPTLTLSLDDRWAAWLASERQRDQDTQDSIRTALILMVVVIALGGAIYLSFGGPQ